LWLKYAKLLAEPVFFITGLCLLASQGSR